VGRTILVADDSAAIQKKASGILAGEGLEVFTVSNGVAAIKKLPLLKPLLVLADVSMPGKDGYEVCEFIKTTPELAFIPVLLLVSDLEPYDEHRGARVRANGMVQKPFDPETLIAVVTKFVAQAEAALAQAQVADTDINPTPTAPEFSVETPPVEEEQAAPPQSEDFAWGALPEGSAFATPAPYETPLAPPEPTSAAVPLPEPQAELAPEAAAAMEEPAAETAPEPVVAPEAYHAEPAPVEYASAAAVEAEPETVPGAPEAGPAEPAPVEPTEEVAPVPSEPVFIEEVMPAVPEPAPEPEMTMMFRAPVEIAEPVLTDELAPELPAEEPPTAVEPEAPLGAAEPEAFSAPTAEPEIAPAAEETAAPVEAVPAAEVEAVPAAEEAVASPVEAAPPAEEAGPEVAETPPPVAEAQPVEVAVAPTVRTPVLDPDWVFWIVRSVVIKMSPPAFSAEAIEEMARRITDEITAELESYTPQN